MFSNKQFKMKRKTNSQFTYYFKMLIKFFLFFFELVKTIYNIVMETKVSGTY